MLSQCKGGVGATTLASSLAACWAKHDLSVALLDLDDVNPQITEWAQVGLAKRKTVIELLRHGAVPKQRINELAHPVEGYDGKLVAIGQPENYHESFQLKADVLDGTPSCENYIKSLLTILQDEFDAVVIDGGRSWGIATFAALPFCQNILLVTDDDGMSLYRTLATFQRIYRESDDTEEFDLKKWHVVLNAYTAQLLSPKEVADEIQQLNLFPETSNLFTVPFSETGRQWGAPAQSFYELAEDPIRNIIEEMAFSMIPFRQQNLTQSVDSPLYSKLRRRIQALVS